MTDNSLLGIQFFESDCEESTKKVYSSHQDSNWIQKSIQNLDLKASPSNGIYVIVADDVDEEALEDLDNEKINLSKEQTAEFNLWRSAYSKSFLQFEKEFED
ncbi:MAG: hypothetical protein SVR81_07440 [Chloroflexota bacterium]|nr:hypothetical protein [Chloroflexota bacterium]